MRISIGIATCLLSFSTIAGTPRSIEIVADVHGLPSCLEQSRMLVQRASEGKIILGLEGIVDDDPESTLETYVKMLFSDEHYWETHQQELSAHVFGLESASIYHFSGYLLYSQHLGASYTKYVKSSDAFARSEAANGINKALAGLANKARIAPDFRQGLLDSFEAALGGFSSENDLIQAILMKVSLPNFIATLAEGYVPRDIRLPQDRFDRDTFFYRYLNRVLQKLPHPEEQRIFETSAQEDARNSEAFPKTSEFPEINLYDVLWRNQTFFESSDKRLPDIALEQPVVLSVGEAHVEDLARLIRASHPNDEVKTSYDCVH